MNSSNNNNNDRTATFMWDHINSQAYSKAIATTTTTSTATTDNNNNSSNNISVMPKLNRLNIAPMTTSTTPPDLHSLPTKQQPDHPDMTDSSKRRRIDPLPIIDANNHSQHYEHHYRGQQLSVNNNNNFYARPLFSSLPARMNSNLRQLQQQQLFTSPSSSPPQQQAHQIHRSQSLASLRSIDVSSSMQQQQQQQQYPYALPPAHHSRPSAPTLSPSLSMQTVTDLYRQQQQQSRPQSQPLIRHHHHSNNEHSSSTITTVQQQQYQQVSSAPSSLSFIKTTPSPQQQQLAGEDDDDLIVDEEMTNKNVCIGMIKTDIVTVRPLDLIKDEQFEPIRLESEGKRDSVNYSFTVTSRGTPRKFYGWVPFEDTKILGPLVDHRLIWWDALIPRGKINHARTPLYIILYCRPSHVDIISKSFECYHATLKEPPFFNPACRYKNPHQQLLLRQQQQQLDNNNRLWSVGRPGGGGSRSYSPALLSEQQQQATEQTRRDIAQLLDSIDDEANRRKLRKRKKRQEKLQKIGTKDNQIVLSDDDDNNNGERNNNRSNDMNDGNEKMAIDEINKEDDGDEDDEEGTQVDGLTVKLMPHQSRGVDWMIGREANETSSGGILADDMGLGKTIQTIGLMVSTMEAAAKRPTLIITPLALIQQWATEIRTKTEKGKVSVLVYHGANRSKDPSVFLQYDVVITTYQVVASDIPNTTKRGRRRNINSLNNNTNDSGAIDEEMTDIQTPGVSEDSMTPSSSAPGSPNNRKLDDHSKNNNKLTKPGYGPLFQIEWYRVVLDEAQQIKNRNTRSALSCTELGAKKRWCLTGTPMQNHVDELYSLLRFLRIQPLCDFQSFKKTISIPIQAGQGQLALERLKVVLMAVMLRRTKQILKSRQEAEEQDEDEEEGRTQEEQPRASSSTTTASVSGVVTEEATLGSNNSHGSSPATSSLLSSNVQPKKEYSESSNLSTELSLKLPPRNKRDVVLTFSSAERKFYDFLNTKTKSTVERLFRAGKGERNYLNMLCMLLRLRQACDHPKLVLKAMGNDADALDELSTAAARNNNNSVSPSSSSSISNSGAGGRKDAREANSEAIAQRTIMAKMAADLGWQGVGQVGQSVFDKDSNNGNTNSGEGSLCELCGRINNTKSRSGSYCSACTKQIEFYTQQQQQDQQDDDTNISLMTTSSKSNKVLEILNETRLKYPREKTIIFSQFTSMLDLMEEQLQRSGFKYCRYDGSMSNHLREKNLDALRTDNECTIMLISLKCGSLGLNLTAANHVILMDVWWNPSVEEQAIDRVHRIGQRKPVRVVRLVIDGTIEQKIIKLQQKKAQMVQGALGDGMIKNSKLTMREIRTLFDL